MSKEVVPYIEGSGSVLKEVVSVLKEVVMVLKEVVLVFKKGVLCVEGSDSER